MEKIRIPESAMKYFRRTGSLGGKTRAEMYSHEQLQQWGSLGGRPRKDGTRPVQRQKKGGK